MRLVNVMKVLLQILDLTDWDMDVDALVSSEGNARGVKRRTHIVFIALDDFKVVVLLRSRTERGQLGDSLGTEAVIA